MRERLRDRFRGCLSGGAVGDALGAPVEFMKTDEIERRFGPSGIRDYAPKSGEKGTITDDTQMTLFTAEGLMLARRTGADPVKAIRAAYDAWMVTQRQKSPSSLTYESDLVRIPELNSRRAPGMTCLTALKLPFTDDGLPARNHSKGCGGVMRVAPIGLVEERPYDLACAAAALTHGHPLGYESAGVFAVLIRKSMTMDSLAEAMTATVEEIQERTDVGRWLVRASELAASDRPALACIRELGQGWVAEEALAIGAFAALRGTDFEEAVVIAVNHSGDSDSTGSIAGQLLGAHRGWEVIPSRWLDNLELRDQIENCADNLFALS